MVCTSCHAELIGPYCAQCGQKHRKNRYSLKSILQDALSQLLSLDRGVFHTTILLFRKPAEVVSQYVSGKSRPFTNPIRFFLIWVTVAQLAALWSGGLADFAQGLADGGASDLYSADANEIVSFLTRYYVTGLALSFPFLALGTLVFFFSSGRNLAENLIFHLYLVGQSALYISFSFLVLGIFGDQAANVLLLLAMSLAFVGYIRASIAFYNKGVIRTSICITLAVGLALLVYIITISFIIKLIITIA